MKNLFFASIALLIVMSITNCSKAYMPNISQTCSLKGTDVFQPDSLNIANNYKMPEWFSDGKLGIFIHWGIYSVPAYGNEWYARWMYKEGDGINKYHTKTYGELDKFGYKDFIPMFKADKFNADEWADLFAKSGATYVVPVAEHHDGFAMYNSAWNKWNSMDMGPKIDIIGELAKAVRARNLHFGLSSHRAENAWFYNNGLNVKSDVRDEAISMYGERLKEPGGAGMTAFAGVNEGSNEKSRKEWLMHTYELIDMYQPDLIWFDWTVGKYPFQPTFYKFMSYYYNNALDWGKDVVVNTKVGFGDGSQIFDIERGKSDRIRYYPWQTDTSIGKKSWSFTPDEENKTPNHIIDDFVDIVSKNGNLLLNIGPRSDGTITEEQKTVLIELGKWLKINSEAIYNTRAWVRWGEGDNAGTSGYMTDGKATNYYASDIRFTSNDGVLYAISLAKGDKINIKSLSAANTKDLKVKSVSMLGTDSKINWKQSDAGLEIEFPSVLPTDYAHSFKIEFDGIVYGDMQIDNSGESIVVEQYIANNSDKNLTESVTCQLSGQEAVTKSVNVPSRGKSYVKYNIDAKTSEEQELSLTINGNVIATKKIKPVVKHGVHQME